MINVIHTFKTPDHNTAMHHIRNTIKNINTNQVPGFKYASLNQMEDSQDFLLVSKWDSHASYENWVKSIEADNPIAKTPPQYLTVMEEKYPIQ